SSVGVGALDRPAGGQNSKTRRCELRAVHQPHAHGAVRVTPENVALAVAVEVVGIRQLSGHGHGAVPGIYQIVHVDGANAGGEVPADRRGKSRSIGTVRGREHAVGAGGVVAVVDSCARSIAVALGDVV